MGTVCLADGMGLASTAWAWQFLCQEEVWMHCFLCGEQSNPQPVPPMVSMRHVNPAPHGRMHRASHRVSLPHGASLGHPRRAQGEEEEEEQRRSRRLQPSSPPAPQEPFGLGDQVLVAAAPALASSLR